ncbi:hypothetical protein WJX72_007754 [[Myrmecia] bisecta]|uniref:NAD-dependent epimerase/dehydratase domain-containing protein n=1 Tax=[Myrmecia] bisecta TaxID=41462 RepID=A0AAW1QSN0_9CHLO
MLLLRRLPSASSLRALQPLLAGDGGRREASQLTKVGPLALTNKGLKAGPGGRSSVSGVVATVFGCSGFLGRYVVNALAQSGSQVVCPFRCDDLDVQHLRQMGDLGQIVYLKDFKLRSDEAVRHAIHRSNVVINLLGIEKETMNYTFDEVHVDFAQRIAKACAESEVCERLLHVSCLGASEKALSRRLQTKAKGEAAVQAAFKDATIFRPAQMVGVEDRLFNTYAQLAKRLPFIPLVDGGHAKLQPVYVRDVADGIVNSLKLKDAPGKTYHLAGPDVLTVKQIVDLVFHTIREPYKALTVPGAIAKLVAAPREMLFKKVPIPMPTFLTADYVAEMQQDNILPVGELGRQVVPTLEDLDVDAMKVTEGIPIEHVRHYRVGGYDFGTTSERQATGGAGYGGGPHQPSAGSGFEKTGAPQPWDSA